MAWRISAGMVKLRRLGIVALGFVSLALCGCDQAKGRFTIASASANDEKPAFVKMDTVTGQSWRLITIGPGVAYWSEIKTE